MSTISTAPPPPRARSTSRAVSIRDPRASAPIVIDAPPRSAKSPLIVDLPARPRSRSVGRNGPLAVEPPGLSGGRGMFKRLIVACDGTWQDSDDGRQNGRLTIPSNITRISRAIKAVSQDGIQQIVDYHSGVGTEGTRFSRFISGTLGKGLAENVREAYSFVANNYNHGDEIFLLGFSRGAFTARSIAGLIGEIGLLTKKGLNALPEIYEDVQHRRDPDYVPVLPDIPFTRKMSAGDPRYRIELERRGLTRLDINIKAVGVWDTVGSLGIPRIGALQRMGLQMKESRATAFYDTKLSNCVENAFQALALDETRATFSPAVWEKPEGNRTTLRQVWFPGAHANVGGGYDDMQLANISLAWMMSQLEPFLDMRAEYLYEQAELAEKYHKREEGEIRPWSFGRIYNELKGITALGGSATRKPGQYTAVDPFSNRSTSRPLRQTNEYIHPSVRARFRLSGPGILDRGTYDPRGLTDSYKLIVDYGPNDQRAADPEVYWKLRARDPLAVKVLPEAPLWRLERELAKRDARTYEFVRSPPQTAKKGERDRDGKGRRSHRPVSADMTNSRVTSAAHFNGDGFGPLSPPLTSGSRRRRDTFSPRQTFSGVDGRRERRSSVALPRERGKGRERSRSRARSVRSARSVESWGEGETEIREGMPHRREKGRAWWEGRG